MIASALTRACRALPLVLSLAALTACESIEAPPPDPNRYGAIDIRGKATSATNVTARATAIFFESLNANVPSSEAQRLDQCVFSALDTIANVVRGVDQAGDRVDLTIRSSTIALPYEPANLRYATPAASPFTYAVNDSVTVVVPGSAKYPAASVRVRLAEPILPGAVTIPAAGADMIVTWNGIPDLTSAVLLSLRYANPPTAGEANRQLYCALKDDGRFEIPSSALNEFRNSPNVHRTLSLVRFRTNDIVLPDNRTVLHVATTVDTIIKF